jgi:imidazole glycerol-phosphate synthase subunit HisF
VSLRPRFLPALLMRRGALIKTVRFGEYSYVGDPINVVRIFGEKEVDELLLLDIFASRENSGPDFSTLNKLLPECFMPVCYGGGVEKIDQMRELYSMGIEKISLNTATLENPGLITNAANEYGSQAVVVTIDVKRSAFGRYSVRRGGQDVSRDVPSYCRTLVERGAGEIVVSSIDRDGTWAGFDCDLIRLVSGAVNVPVVALGGAGSDGHLLPALQAGASAVAMGSMSVFQSKGMGVLVRFPDASVQDDIVRQLRINE